MIGAELRRHSEQVIPEGANSGKRAVLGIDDLVSAAACGAHFRNLEGREYVDYHAAFGPQVLGHCNPEVDRAFQAAVARVDLPGVAVTELEIEVAERIAGHVP